MHLKTKKKKKKSPRPAPTAGSCAPRRRLTSSTAPAAARVLHQWRPVPLAATNQLVLHERERRASKYCDPISPHASDENE